MHKIQEMHHNLKKNPKKCGNKSIKQKCLSCHDPAGRKRRLSGKGY